MAELRTISARIPEDLYKEMSLRVPEGDRSNFVRDAIMEKLEKTPKPDRILNLEQRVAKIESELSQVRKYLADLELVTYGRERLNPHSLAADDIDHKIIDYLLHYKGGTTPEIAEYVKTNRWLILYRLRKIQKNSRKELGQPIVSFCASEKAGKKKSWWIDEELIEATR